MRPIALLGVAALAALVLPLRASAAGKAAAKPAQSMITYEYRYSKNPENQAVAKELAERKVLEQFAEALSVLKLPRPLKLQFLGCNGTSNAWYDPTGGTVNFCYEYVTEFKNTAATKDLGKVPLQDAVNGPLVYIFLHETGHAVFDYLKVPIMGREEDAADYFAAVILLRMGKGIAMRSMRGTAWLYGTEAKSDKIGVDDFADSHGLNAQRYFNILCLAYGSDPEYFAAAVTEGKLPKDRAEWCGDEYRMAAYAVKKLIAPSIDAVKVQELRSKYAQHWDQPVE
jgi:hypothetical protein